MAQNFRYNPGQNIDIPVPVGTKSGDPLVFGEAKIPCTANIDRTDDGTASVRISSSGSAMQTVRAINAGGNSAIAVGDTIYFDNATTPKLSKVATGSPYGAALTTLGAGLTGQVEVLVFAK